MSKRDYYDVLNISKDATDDEIKSAYRRMAKKYHPDLNPDDEEAEQRLKEINEAYEVLSDPEKRARYDRFGHAGVDGQSAGGGFNQDFGGFGDIFDDLFDVFGSGHRSRKPGPERGMDLRYDLTIDFEEAYFGVEKEIEINRMEKCSNCSGSGVKPGSSKETCTKCSGSGEVRYAQNTPFGQFVRVATCDECNGSGEIIKEKCGVCHGTGKESKTRKIKVKIPAGVKTGSIISIKGEGEDGERGGPSGDLYIYISVKEHEIFERRGNDLYCEIPITFPEATLGANISIPTLEDDEEYNIPAGTQTGSKFKIKNKGFPNVRGYGRGDLIFKVVVQVPKKLTKKQKELLIEFAKESGDELDRGKKGFFDKMKDAFGS